MNKITNIKLISSLEKLYFNDDIPNDYLKKFSMLKNEKKSFQIAIMATEETEINYTIETNIKNYKLYKVTDVKSDFPMAKAADDYYRFSENGYYPDLLVPISNTVKLNKNINSIWVEIDANENQIGNYNFKVSIEGFVQELEVEIIDAELDFSDFVYTNWFHTDCLMSHYGFEAFSQEYWQVVENFLETACDYGMNCVLTPIFTPPLDTEVGKERPTVQLVDISLDNGKYSFNFDKLTKWIDMAHRCGITHFEMAHFFTQWGARSAPKIMATVDGQYQKLFGWETKSSSKEYKNFLIKFSVELKKHLEGKNLKDKVLIHVSDEPNFSVLRSYAKASKLIHKLFNGYKIVDALSDIWFYRLGIVSHPIPSNDHIDKFLGKSKDLWTYYCSAQNKKYVSNRFFCNESIRTRIIGYQMYKFNIKGFLHWGYNFYYSQLSKGLIDPFTVTDAGAAFPSGDSFAVYPGEDKKPLQSLRLKVFYDALQDMAALNTLEKLTNKSECLKIIEESGKYKITFSNYPHSNEWLLTTREKINAKIKENI